MAPTRRSSSRLSQPKQPKEEKKPQNLIDYKEKEVDENERFFFSFAEEGLTAKQCAQKMGEFQTRAELIAGIPPDELGRFITKSLIGMKAPMKCFDCDRMYASSSGILNHFKRCEVTADPAMISAKYREDPGLWLKVAPETQESILEHIVGSVNQCFAGCTQIFGSRKELIDHLEECINTEYQSFKDRPVDFRQLDPKIRGRIIRDAIKQGPVECLICGKVYSHVYGLSYHIDRCQVDRSEQPWKCHRCGFKATTAESEEHLIECGRAYEMKVMDKLDSLFSPGNDAAFLDDDDPIVSKRRRSSAAPRMTQRKDGSILYRFRKSTVNREFNGVVSHADQKKYEQACSAIFDEWKLKSLETPFHARLFSIPTTSWQLTKLSTSDALYQKFQRESVTLTVNKSEGLQKTVPVGTRVKARRSAEVGATRVAFCGAPINSIRVAPGKTASGDDVICVCTFGNETDLESESSIVQFWRHSTKSNKSQLELWFLLHLPHRGTILSMTWLQKEDDSGLIGFAAFSTTFGEVLVYKVDEQRVPAPEDAPQDVSVVLAAPDIILTLGKLDGAHDDQQLTATIKVEGEEMPAPARIDSSRVPILKIAWSAESGGRLLAGIDALGHILLWDLDLEDGTCCARRIETEWQSPPSDVAWLKDQHVAVAFRERLVKVFDVNDWTVTMEESTMKTAGTRVYTDARLLNSFFTFNSEYMSFPFPNATSVAYIGLDLEASTMIIVPTGNTHQLMTWDVAICARLGTLYSCGVDGRLIGSATGRLLPKGGAFFANRNVMSLRRRKILQDATSLADFLKAVKEEGVESKPAEATKEPLEESCVEHDDVCSKMWLEMSSDEPFSPGKPELSCRDQRIESLNCVDVNDDAVVFTGGEAGLLFAVPSKLRFQELDL